MLRYRLITLPLLLSFTLMAQDTSHLAHIVRASAEARVTAKPDRAEISIGVSTQAPNAADASTQNAAQTTRLLDALKKAIGAGGQVQTSAYSIMPQYDYSKHGVLPQITGYQTNNTVKVTLNDISQVGKIIDTATQAGANNIAGISFTIQNDQEFRARALAEAATKARANAEAIAKALNLHVVGVLQAESSETSPIRPVMMQAKAFAGAATAPTPVEEGTVDIQASVVVTLQVAP